LNSHEISASNNFRTKLTKLTGGFTDVSIKEQHDSQMFADKKGETICIPPDFGSPTHTFHKEVLERCEVAQHIQNEVLSALNCLRNGWHQTMLSQKDFFENTTLDDTQLPSTQLGSNAESDDSLNFEVGVNKQKIFERLIDDKHPWKSITNFQIVAEKRQVQVEWWEKEQTSNRHVTTWEPMTKWMKGSKQRKELIKHLSKNCGEDKLVETIGQIHWEKLKGSFPAHRSNDLSESNSSKSLSCSDRRNHTKHTGDVSPSTKKNQTRKRNDRCLPDIKKRKFRRAL